MGRVASKHDTLTAQDALPSGALHPIAPSRLEKPKGRPDIVSVGTVVWLASELMFFAAIFAAYFWTRSMAIDRAGDGVTLWDVSTQHLDVVFASINTAILVTSSITCQLGANAAERGVAHGSWLNPLKWGMRQAYIVTFILGSIFIGGQVWEYFTLFSEGYFVDTNVYWSLFFLSTGFHGIHVFGGLVAFLFVLARSYMTRTHTHEQTVAAHVVSYYWHFVDVIWVALFIIIYVLR